MPNNDVYIMYSGATDVTGQKLQEALDITGGRVLPKTKKKIVVGWGAKTGEDLGNQIGGADCVVLNHPDAIRLNRNKFQSILALGNEGINIKSAASAEQVFAAMEDGSLVLPLVGRRNFHQGGKGFWTCLTKSHVQAAIEDEKGAQYFQNFIDVADEYRLHIIDGNLVYAQKKVKRNGIKANTEAFIEQQKEKINVIAAKNDKDLDADTMEYVLSRLSKEHQSVDMIVKSNTRGWRFSRISYKNVKKNLLEEAIKALDASGLTFGAVDCAVDSDGKAWIIEINSGPGLEKSSLEAYVDTFKILIEETLNPPKTEEKVIVSKTGQVVENKVSGSRAKLQAKLAVLSDLVSVASEEESAVLANLWDRLG